MAGYRDLIVWQRSMELVEEIYRVVKILPREERIMHWRIKCEGLLFLFRQM